MRNIAIIPARSGSKGLTDKNIKMFCDKPLMAWTIEAAINSKKFDEIMVSTDSEEYGEIAREYGASVPFLRSCENARDISSSWDVVREVISMYKLEYKTEFDTFCLLQPTSPLRRANDIKKAYDIYELKKASAVISICPLEHSINICNRISSDGSLNGFYNSNVSGRRQDSEKFYRLNGAIYIQNVSDVLNRMNLYGEESYAYIMDKINSIDIDDEIDFIQAEAVAKWMYS